MGGYTAEAWNEEAEACRRHYMEQSNMAQGYSRRWTQGEMDEMAMDGPLEYRIRRYREQREELEAKHSKEMRELHERHAKQVGELVARLDDANKRCAAMLDAKLT